ncbi:hypothetical protein JTE90_021815 [Oedothorax gibbosus]|uniref:Uncharacterized protein n=1 Tax=Oedothorax gibbosus TaxID=931172 RepID=A0AAV6TJM5_9ARAC|nr:hypothetical protein JTE90_021815 [Oedothorax gibbosus]
MGLAPTLGNSPGQGDLLQSPSPARSLLNATFPHALASGDSALGFSRFTRRKSLSTIEGPPPSKWPLYLILPQKYCHKIKYETTSHSRQTVSRLTTSRAAYCSGGEETTRVEKDDKRVELATAHGIQLTPTRSPMLRSQYAPYSPQK